ncbi:FtsX-like permease family protein [Streptomyces sp. SP17BM10]|uniref:FtsX-like permease family protein n=1 Tax=Streptomyces sp. SP17BM10 TaxID=3002530 RepID=UPI002E769884|nr:FtsX-like permease family protein [Streptomyces sp. SP17BM10]MEE1784866.1 FtsX-like permease family protein [Streptomyces sp. SP17BM10]
MTFSSWRVALRIARRDALRAKGRSALVVAMVALPVLGVTGADVVFRSAQLSPAERAVRVMGHSDAELHLAERGETIKQAPDPGDGITFASADTKDPTPEERRSRDTDPGTLIRQLLPAGATFVPERHGPFTATTSAQGLISADTVEADLTDPVWRGKIDLVGGRAPSAPHEIAVTRTFLDRSHLALGATTAVRGLDTTPFTITGVVEYPGELSATTLVARPGELVDPLAKLQSTDGGEPPRGLDHWLVTMPPGTTLDWPKVTELNKYGFTATSRAVLTNPPPRAAVPYYTEQENGRSTPLLDRTAVVMLATVVGMALLEIVLLAGPAFAVGARRSRRQLGLLAAGGGDRSQIRAVVLGGGVVLGTAGAVTGLALGAGLVLLLRTRAEEYAGQRFGHFALNPLDLTGVLLIGLVTGLLAAIVPAVQAARQDVVSALTGRDSLKPPSRWLALLGLAMVGGGAALAIFGTAANLANRSVTVLGGSMIAELGMVALVPYLVGLFGRIGRRLPLGPRLALRDSVRHRGRTAPAVAAVMAAVAGAVAVSVYAASSDEQNRRDYVASAPAGAVILGTGWGPASDGSLLPQMRAAVESSIPDLGRRADVKKLTYPANCVDGRGTCGWITPLLPPQLRCPLDEDDGSLPADEVQRLHREDKRCQYTDSRRGSAIYGSLGAGDATMLRNLHGVTDPAAVQALADGKAVVFDPRYVKDGKLVLRANDPAPPLPSAGVSSAPYHPSAEEERKRRHDITVDAYLATSSVKTATAVFSPDAARRLGLGAVDAGSAWLPDSPPGDGAEQKAAGAIGKLADHTEFSVERGYQPKGDLISLGLSGFAALVALGAAGIATGLAAADSQRDLTTLAAVGATPRIRRTLSGFQCGVIAAMGALLGIVCGAVPAVALRKVLGAVVPYPGISPEEMANRSLVVVPWGNIALLVIGLPIIAVVLATLLTRSRITLLRRTG